MTAVRELGIEVVLERQPSEISYGMRRLTVIARAIAAKPRILFMDEPAAGLDERERSELVRIIRRLAKEWNMAILLIEHDVAMVSAVSDRMIALDFGSMIASGDPDEVRAHPSVVASYLGIDEVEVEQNSGASIAEITETGLVGDA